MTTDRSMDINKLETKGGNFVLSRSPDKAMQEMMETITALRSLYIEENAALEAADTKLFLSLQERKFAAVSDYRAGAQQFIDRKDEFKKIDPQVRGKLTKMYEEFSVLGTANMDALTRMRKNVQRLTGRIMNAACESVQKKSVSYEARGTLKKYERPVSMGLNESA